MEERSSQYFKNKGSKENDTAITGAKLFIFFYFMIFLIFFVWFSINGGFNEPWRQLISFLAKGEVSTQNLSWQTKDTIIGFVLLNLGLSVIVVVLLSLIFGKGPMIYFEKWKRFLDLKMPVLLYDLLGGVAAEEIVFRWFPLVVLLPLWNTSLALWTIILGSSIIFGLLHIFNYKPGQRKGYWYWCTPQILSGVIDSYILLSYSFWGALFAHLIFDVLVIVPLKIAHNVDPQLLAAE